jgi:hypothetical protein
MAKGNGIRGIRGHHVPTNRVLRSASYVQVRGKPRHAPRKASATAVRVAYTQDAINQAIAKLTVLSQLDNRTARS